MATRSERLNDRQLEVLRWVSDGCPTGVWSDFTHKHTAYALNGRGLVEVDKRRHHWNATITAAGAYYLEHLDYPPSPPAYEKKPTRERLPVAKKRLGAVSKPKPKVPSKSDQLIERIAAAGGELRVDGELDKVNYDALVKTAIRFGKVPEGKLLTIDYAGGYGKRIIKLKDPPEWMTAALTPLEVPVSVRKPHPAVAVLRDDRKRLVLRGSIRSRAVAVLQALAMELERRGHRVSAVPIERGYVHPRDRDPSLLTVTVHGHSFGLTVWEKVNKVRHEASPAELRRAEREPWFRVPANDEVPSGHIVFGVRTGRPYRQSEWVDKGDEATTVHLAQILQELELRAGAAEEARLEQERTRQAKEVAWEAAMELAREKLVEATRAEVLMKQLARWERANALAAYIDAMRERLHVLTEVEEREEAEHWVEWATRYAASLNPVAGRLRLPDAPPDTAQNLQPFLDGWSAYGPHMR